MKQISTLLLFLFFAGKFYGKHVNENTAKLVGKTFLVNKTNSETLKNASNLQLIYAASGGSNFSQSKTFFYIFNVDANGFVIVAGDDNVTPILGYSSEGVFDVANLPLSVSKWLEGYKNEIRFVIDNHIMATTEIAEEWQNLIAGNNSNVAARVTVSSVSPLIQTKWNQSPYYNALCPGGSVTGCVATAVAQVMKFWNYPTTGSGFHSYNHQTYGTLSANFANTTYQWGSMPNIVSSQNNAVATLMRDIGVSVNMNYSPSSSGAWVIDNVFNTNNSAESALRNYFGYKSSLDGVSRLFYSQTQWLNLIKGELNAGRPIVYDGFGSGGGHCFVADGYDINDYIHFNWGWAGHYDGFFQINALNPSGVGTGGGSGEYNNGQQMIIGIEPPPASQSYSIKLYNYVTPSASIINYGQAFTVTTNVTNAGINTFSGDYCAAIFDNTYNFIDNIQILTGYSSLQGGYAYINNLSFSTTGLSSMTPGSYHIGIFYRPTGGSWTQVLNNGNYSNLVPITVVNPNSIELNSAITVTTGTTITQGTSATVNFNIKNYGTSSFIGKYRVSLFNSSGTLVQTINTLIESSGLPAGSVYASPYLLFSTSSVTVAPGTNNLRAEHNPNNTGWQMTGSSYYQNQKQITVVAPIILPDTYEVNDTTNQSYNLPISFTGSVTTKNTVGSNLHVITDNDYFKVNLPAGYNYTITPRLHDSYNSGNGNVYTVDALFSYSTDGGITWSEAYDDIITGDIILNGGGTVYFHIAPYFAGNKGTYLFDITLRRSAAIVSNIWETETSNFITVYPNPAKYFVTINLTEFKGKLSKFDVLTAQGQLVLSVNPVNEEKMFRFPVANLTEGIYFIQFVTDSGIQTKKIIIDK